jgi:ferredoxin, 2Fe-2S
MRYLELDLFFRFFWMPKVTFVAFTGAAHTVEVPVGTTLMRAATDNRVPGIDGDCGGNCACATCHIYVDPNWSDRVGARSATEEDMLNIVAEPRGNSRLACQIIVTDALNGLIVSLPEAQH